jgi:hypothetical protein
MLNRLIACCFLLLCILVGCSYQETVRHYTGIYIGSNDVLTDDTASPWKPVEATYNEFHSSGAIFMHFFQAGQPDALIFQQGGSVGWRWTNLPPSATEIDWSDTSLGQAEVYRTFDSLTVSINLGSGGEAFYLKQDSEWVSPVHAKSRFFGIF